MLAGLNVYTYLLLDKVFCVVIHDSPALSGDKINVHHRACNLHMYYAFMYFICPFSLDNPPSVNIPGGMMYGEKISTCTFVPINTILLTHSALTDIPIYINIAADLLVESNSLCNIETNPHQSQGHIELYCQQAISRLLICLQSIFHVPVVGQYRH